jgi:hypothetical protein
MVTMQTIKTKCKLLLICISLTLFTKGYSQYTFTPYPPPPEFTFDDLWHFTITGPVVTDYTQFYVAMRIFNDQGTLLLKSNTDIFALPNAVLYVDKTDLSAIDPFTTLYYDNTYQSVVANGDFFPAGTYNIVYTLLGRPADGEFTELAEANITAVVNLFMPPILIYPEDMDTIDTPYPLLTWLPAYQASAGQSIFYNLRLVEMFSGQTSASAIAANPAYFEQYDLPITAIPYPASANPIELDHTYAWQVAATIAGVPVAYSQIWQFTYAIPTPVFPEEVDHKQYYSFFEKLDGAVVPVEENSVRMRVEENYNNFENYLSFNIYNDQNQLVASSSNLSIQVINGVRFVEIPLCGGSLQLDQDQIYLIEIFNVKHEKKFLRIQNKFDTNNCQ